MVLESVVQYLSELGQNILTAARNFTFKDAIDVAIVTVLLYSAIKLVRETRGIPIPLAFLFPCFFDTKILQLPNEVIVFHFIILKSKAQRKRKP